jgi:hypothetical protein
MRSSIIKILFLLALFVAGCGGDSATSTPAPTKPVVMLQTDRTTAYQGLDTITITWAAQDAAICTASGVWQGTRATSGSERLLAPVAGTYQVRLSCSNATGSTDAVENVEVRVLSHASCKPERFEDMGLPDGPVQMGQYVVTNSVWALPEGSSSCTQAQMTEPSWLSFSMEWNIPLPPETEISMKGFMNASVGRVDPIREGSLRGTSPRLPVRVADVPETLTISFDAEYQRAGQFATLADFFFYPRADGDGRQAKELMLLLDVMPEPPWYPSDSVTLDLGGLRWMRLGKGGRRSPHPWFPEEASSYLDGIQYHLSPYGPKGTFHLKPILDDLVSIGFLSPDDWMIFIQWGVEPATGINKLKMHRYEVRW